MSDQSTQGSAALFAKMARVMSKISRLKKTGKHPTQGYPFATDADVSDLVRELLAEEGIAFLPGLPTVEQRQIGATKSGAPITRSIASFVFTFGCSETGAIYSLPWYAEADDTSDKGINKTATAAVKYFLLKTFLISTGDTPDPDAMPDIQHVKQATQSKRPIPPQSDENKATAHKTPSNKLDAENVRKIAEIADFKDALPNDSHRKALVELLDKNGIFAGADTMEVYWTRIAMYMDERAYGTIHEKKPEAAIEAVKKLLADFAGISA